jgi:C4-dicarboxylate-specific signal transduction histidine kinase
LLKAIVTETLELCEPRFRSGEIFLSASSIPADLEVECRGAQISQVLVNLLNNAYDAVQGLPEKWVSLDVNDAGERIELAVTDSGPGLPAEVRAKLFQPFFTTKPEGQGIGLGLSLSKAIVETHRGTLTVDTASRNTRFVVQLPKRQPWQKAGNASAEATPGQQSE